jgi:alkanesulfonate monooxygenase SsuD/methylene tetrahydromethanopterin reductase-like flavin-dependent oxidoreductase (luciferase family)
VDVGIGIGNVLLGMGGGTLVEWARRAEARGFSSLGTIGRLVWPTYDELAALAAAAAVTERIGLVTDVLLAPTYDTARLAKLTASVDAISDGRLTLGVGVGARGDDYEASGQDMHRRGRRLDRQLEELHESWAGGSVEGFSTAFGPTVPRGRIPLLFGGGPERAATRAAPAGMVRAFRAAHASAGGSGAPRVVCLTYVGLGDEAESLRQLRAYYAVLGDRAEMIARSAARSPEDVRSRVRAYETLGADELIFMPTVPDADEVDRLADALA